MKHASAGVDRVHPHPLLRGVVPDHLEAILTNRTVVPARRRVGRRLDVPRHALTARLVRNRLRASVRRDVCETVTLAAAAADGAGAVAVLRGVERFVPVVDFAESDPLELVDVPAAADTATCGVDEALVRAEVQVEVACLASAAGFSGGEAAAAGAALRGLLSVERV